MTITACVLPGVSVFVRGDNAIDVSVGGVPTVPKLTPLTTLIVVGKATGVTPALATVVLMVDVKPLAVIAAVPPSAWKSTPAMLAASICATVTEPTPQF